MASSSQDVAFEDTQRQFQLLQVELAKLRDIWSKTRQSKGGIIALRGFQFQMLTALNHLVRRWADADLSTQNEPSIMPMWIEALSDWTETEPTIVACQVKRTQGSSEISEALTEFWLIEKLAKANCSDLVSTLRYRILSQKPKLKNVAGAIARWFPRDESDSEAVQLFKEKISAVITSEPETEILSLLANRLNAEDPLGHVQRWLGLLFSVCDTNSGFEPALRQIWSDLQKLRQADRSHSPIGYFWTVHDLPPDAVVPGPVLTGQRPAVWHLREGYFANRKSIYEKLVEASENWINRPRERSSGPKLRFFWIGGRSGTGKSIALLHGLAGLQETGSRDILWLENNLDLLPEAVRWCRPLLRQQRTVIIGIDDPYSPTHQATALSILGRVNSELLTLQQEGPDASLPYFICSGPSEQRVRFKQDLADLVDVEHSDLPLETHADLRELWEWFCIRSGREQKIPYQEGEDVLLVQLFFEWRTGQPLPEFAGRFKRRIEGMEGTRNGPLSTFLARLIALNRIYAGYSSGALLEFRSEPQFEVGFNRLSDQEHHLRIEDERLGVWFAHPHLAHAIYEAWFHPVEDEPTRRDHLVHAAFDALKFGKSILEKTVPLWAIARLFSPGIDEGLRQRLPLSTASALLREVYRQLKMQFPQMPIWLVPVWIQIQVTVPDLQLDPSPLQDALGALSASRTAEPGMKLLCYKLIKHFEKLSETFPELLGRIRDFLVDCQEWREWPMLARAYCLETRRRDLVPVIEKWLLKHAEDSFASSLLQAALRVSRDEGIIEAGYRWLRTIGFNTRMWSFAWEDLYYSCPSNQEFVKLGRRWLETVNANVEGWGFVWQRLHRDFPDDTDHIRSAYEWLRRADPVHNEWTFVWQDLRLIRPEDPVLLLMGRQWLNETNKHHGSWGFVWQELYKVNAYDNDLINLGKRWLDLASPENGGWSFVWQDLHRSQPSDAQLLERARQWLDQVKPEHKSWAFVWQDLSKALPEDNQIFERGRRWLAEVEPEHASWSGVWKCLLILRPGDNEILDLGQKWLNQVQPDHPSWNYVRARIATTLRFDHVLEQGELPRAVWGLPKDTHALDEQRHWLHRTPANHHLWGFIWLNLRDALTEDHQLIEIGLQWLDDASPTHRSWSYVWTNLRKALPKDERVLERGRTWLDQVPPDHPRWKRVWDRLFSAYVPRDRILERGRQWLDEIAPDGQYWRTVWMELRKALPDDEQLATRGRKWLDQIQPSPRSSWPAVWERLRKDFPHDEHLLARGRQWLSQVTLDHVSWPVVWRNLRKALPTDNQLLQQGQCWLDQATPTRKYWELVWLELRGVIPEDKELLERGRQWLSHAKLNHASWLAVWQNLRKALPADDQILQQGQRWLSQAQPTRKYWEQVWLELREAVPEDKELLGRGRQWLSLTTLDHASWLAVWQNLHEALPKDEQLLGEARRWLEAATQDHPARPDLATILHSAGSTKLS